MSARNIRSNLPGYWHAGQKPPTAALDDLDRKLLDMEARYRVKRIEVVPGYAELYVEEMEAQLEYNLHRNKKKSDPHTYYPAKERLFSARWAVRDAQTASDHVVGPLVAADLKLEADALALVVHGSPALVLKAWLIEETGVYYKALKHPELVTRLCSPIVEVYQKRYSLLAQALRTCLNEGPEAALALWKGELEERFNGIHGEGLDYFVELDGANKYSGKGKTGYWTDSETATRPIFTSDPKEIQRNLAQIAFKDSDEYKQIQADIAEMYRLESETFRALMKSTPPTKLYQRDEV